ncbi:hypothetical protein CFC21_033942 [Triticum aestivum]|uniref:Uncharacterized protein n=4 Tax=Triticum TaxID=4564 RepID=A0A9R0RBS4_TRITD|nr:hypothetical protein TRIUR3_24670 [Triticum urartu]KAF7020898.1 hypothetical protein CFC21_033942 [Triticum aestivum]VAH56776.1 unnamed protein product [Triticum turgidum subsp. durum]
MTPTVAAAEAVGEDGRWGEEVEPMTPAVAAAEGSQGARGPTSDAVVVPRRQELDRAHVGGSRPEEEEEHPAPVRRPWNGGEGEKGHRWPHEG